MIKILIFIIILISSEAFAFQYPYLLRSPKGLLMGDAYTAVNDDEYTLFYNPASLARHRNDLTLYPFSGSVAVTNVIEDLDRFEDSPDEPVEAANLLMDYPVHASAGVAPGFKLFNFGISFIANESIDAVLRNRTHPMLDLDLRSDRGVAMGVGIPIGPSRISKKSTSGHQTSIGIGAKYIERTGVKDSLALVGPTVADSLGQDELNDILKSLGRVKGIGWGFDFGMEHLIKNGNSRYVFGVSALDITGTEYEVKNSEENLQVAETPDQVNIGMAMGQEFDYFHYVLSTDVRALNEQMDFGKRVRLGAQVGIPGITVMGGLNSGYYSYGAQLDLGFLKLTGGFYDVELGSKYKQIKSKRFVIYLSLFNFSFDA